jgi:hypothetical protein
MVKITGSNALSWPRHETDVAGQLASSVLLPPNVARRMEKPRRWSELDDAKKNHCPGRELNSGRPAGHSTILDA